MSRCSGSSSAYTTCKGTRWLLLGSLLCVWGCGTLGLELLDLPLADAAVNAGDGGPPLLSLNSPAANPDASTTESDAATSPDGSADHPDATLTSPEASVSGPDAAPPPDGGAAPPSDGGLDPCASQRDGATSIASTCGLGVCARTGTRSCVGGQVVDSCSAAAPTSATDATCDGLDDDCDGMIDEEFAPSASSCGVGVCNRTGTISCVSGQTRDSCAAGAPTSAVDDSFTPGNGLDDDCDGLVDEDVPTCDTTPKTFSAGAYANLTVPGNCHHLTVQLWGGGGASGQNVGLGGSGGKGAGGGYATNTLGVTGPVNLFVGTGGASGCNAGGSNAGSASYAGGSGGAGAGANGADGMVAGGGGAGSGGNAGGAGYYGGGGGGQGNAGILGAGGNAGGGGAATLLFMSGARAVTAGGGGGGGGAAGILLGLLGVNGAAGGSGCGSAGGAASSGGGGGGGGGVCQGSTTQPASGQTPALSSSIPAGRAQGASGSCGVGGDGYAILTFAP